MNPDNRDAGENAPMSTNVVCLRPEADFLRVGVTPPAALSIAYRAPDDSELVELLKEAHAVVIPAVGPVLAPALFEGSRVELVQVTGAGVDRLDQAAMKRFGIMVANVAGGSDDAVAEYTVACALLLLRRLAWANDEIRNGNYAGFRARMVADSLAGLDGLTVGVVGLGNIGLAVARAFGRMGSRLVYHDPAPRDPAAAQAIDARPLALADLLESADIVTLHVPLVAATEGLIGSPEIERMKPGAVLINAARGGIVDEQALAGHLASGHLGGAAVDVYSSEPPPESNPLLSLDGEAARRLLLTPHIAGVTRQSWATLFRSAWENVEGLLVAGKPPQNRVY